MNTQFYRNPFRSEELIKATVERHSFDLKEGLLTVKFKPHVKVVTLPLKGKENDLGNQSQELKNRQIFHNILQVIFDKLADVQYHLDLGRDGQRAIYLIDSNCSLQLLPGITFSFHRNNLDEDDDDTFDEEDPNDFYKGKLDGSEEDPNDFYKVKLDGSLDVSSYKLNIKEGSFTIKTKTLDDIDVVSDLIQTVFKPPS